MKSFEIYPQSPQEIELSKIKWAFWQKSFMYEYCSQYICFFECDTKAIDENGKKVIWLWDYANDKPRIKTEMSKAEIMESEKAKWNNIKDQLNK